MRVIAVDFGSKNIGIAVSDALGITVRPVETIRRTSLAKDLARLQFLIDDLEAEALVVGLPVRLDGTIGDAAEKTLQFVERLRAQLTIPVITQNEPLTSYAAEQIMLEQGLNRAQRRKRSDELAATIILQDYLSTRTT